MLEIPLSSGWPCHNVSRDDGYDTIIPKETMDEQKKLRLTETVHGAG
jgi:hypothetical protein